MRDRPFLFLLSRCGVLLLGLLGLPALAVPAPLPVVQSRYLGTVPLAQLSAGALGSGTLLYYTTSPDRPKLVVQLDHPAGADATARVYDTSTLRGDFVPVTVDGQTVTLPTRLVPALTMRAIGGWWTRAGRPNYSLNFTVYGQAYAIWGEGYSPQSGPSGPSTRIEPGEPAVTVRVRPGPDGWPLWDERRLVPSLGSSGYLRYNYAERKCATPLKLDSGPVPLWPYVAIVGGYEQPSGQMRPPIVVDWVSGHITHVSELVTVRQQNCSYAFYSVAPILAGVRNQPDFESPFAFYDLSGQGQGKPNLILRTERFPARDRFSVGLDRRQRGVPLPKDFQTVRYSWRAAPGDQQWNYKIEVQGFHPYTSRTPLGDGSVTVDAPAYQAYPGWVLGHSWPVVTFAAAESKTRSSSEGIYTYGPRELGLPYLLGNTPQADPGAFSGIEDGFRGEYRYTTTGRPELYFSSLDRRVHLLDAEGGVWPLGPARRLQVDSLAGSRYINHWRLTDGGRRVRELARIGNAVLLLEAGQLSVAQTTAPESLWTGQPPSDPASWKRFTAMTGSAITQPAPDLQAWFGSQGARRFSLSGVQVGELIPLPGGVQFDLQVSSGSRAQGLLRVPALEQRGPGAYTVQYTSAGWSVRPQAPARVQGEATAGGAVLHSPVWLTVRLRNTGTQARTGPADLLVSGTSVKRWDSLEVLGLSEQTLRLAWTPDRSGPVSFVLRQGGLDTALGQATVDQPTQRLSGLWALFSGAASSALLIGLLGGLLLLALLAGWQVWRQL